ncbi:MAG TPA: bifunctional UDP-N-acetylglucosamine diphosphorylase/glucosamine-1-phosphate N-acetyltransferase GlmU [Actinomycetota bacterium]|jgi:bifunctional UDP-N-acetylglucosamine pyrophosphorylase/glucosamine-1-phosphate N-acetyltransferase|nr:bifunctional UDP-N-acetylglucosamine diphosphorylase/glucosamine-1-phosphate N-acetyltransferase GlmU [Actinomycetota bacterium]
MGQGLTVVVLAAGEGKRFRSAVPKPLHPVAGRPLLWHVLAAAAPLKADRTVVVVGNGADQVTEAVRDFDLGAVEFAAQASQRGTGDALAAALPLVEGIGDVLVLSGDTPLVPTALLERLLDTHRSARAAATLLTCTFQDPTGYGRILRDDQGEVTGVVEERDATPAQRALREAGAGMYVFARPALAHLAELRPDNQQGEYYLPDLVPRILAAGGRVVTAEGPEAEVMGVNDRVELAAAGTVLRRRLLERLMLAGVTVTDPATTFVDADVEVGQDTVLAPMTFLEAGTRVGARCRLGPNVRLVGCTVGDDATVSQAVAVQSVIGDRANVGPFASLRPGSDLGEASKAGTFVEVKNSNVGPGSKVPHLSYVGDADIGAGANVGAGTVFVNYDGISKHRTVVGDGAFIGSDTMLVAPVTVGNGAQTAAGSTITKDVPPDALAIERSDQRTIEGWAARRRRRKHKE